jgi:uncharacterized membrane protein
MFDFKKLKLQDLTLLLSVSWILYLIITLPYIKESPLSLIAAIFLTFFIPGYIIMLALYPCKKDLKLEERVILTIISSVFVTITVVFLLYLVEYESRPYVVYFFVCLLNTLFIFIAHKSRAHHPRNEIYIYNLQNAYVENEQNIEVREKKDEDENKKQYRRKYSQKVIKRYASKEYENNETKNDVHLERYIITMLVISIVFFAALNIPMIVTQEKNPFTTLYILGPEGKAENYPENISTNNPIKVIVGIENYEYSKENYTLKLLLDGDTLNTIEISLDHNEKWIQELTIAPKKSKIGRQKLEFTLYKGGDTQGQSYRTVYLWINQVLSSEPTQIKEHEVIDFAEIINPSMDTDDGWEFLATNNSIVSGEYVNGSGIYSSRAFVINSSYEGILDKFTTHTLQQTIISKESANVIISFYIKDTYTKGTTDKDESQYKRVIFNKNVIWFDGVNSDEGWQHIEVPVELQEGNNTLTFTLLQEGVKSLHPVEMLIDEVTFMPESELSPYIKEDNTVEFQLPSSNVAQLPKTSDQKFIVEWNGTDTESGIYYYDILYSTDGTTWKNWITKTTAISAEFEGKEGVTYYFKSLAVDNALNREEDKTTPDTSTTIDTSSPTIELDITPNPTTDTTYFTVEANKPLASVECLITPQNFGSAENMKLTTTNNISWTGKYIIKVQDTYDIEVIAKDYSNNAVYTFGTLYTDETLEELTIDIEPYKTSDEARITITCSTALETEPTVVVKDMYGYKLEVNYDSKEENEYIFTTTTDDEDFEYTIRDGIARVMVTAKTANSMTLYEEDTFIIDRVDPTIESFSPGDEEYVEIDSPTIRASYSDDRAGIDITKVMLKVNGVDVTNDAEIGYSSAYYIAQGIESGKVDVVLTVVDQAGNSNEKEWTFYVLN